MDLRKMKAGGWRISGRGRPTTEEDESLVLFGEMVRREKEGNLSLLDPVSVEFERIQGGHNLYKFPSGKRDFLAAAAAAAAEPEKNDYDWLKTPPATPLFPSLEMEANNNIIDPSMMVVHRELPILRPLKPSRFSNKSGAARPVPRPSTPTSKSSTPSSASSSKSTTPKARLPNSQPPPPPPAAAAAAVVKTTLKQELNLPLKSNTTTKNPTIPKIKTISNMIPRSSYRGVAAAPKIKGSDNAAAAPVPSSTTNVAPTTKAHFAPSAGRGRRIEFRPDSNTNKSASTPSTAARKECVGVEKVSGRRERGGEEKEQRARSGAQGKESLGFGSLVVPKASLISNALKNSKELKKKTR